MRNSPFNTYSKYFFVLTSVIIISTIIIMIMRFQKMGGVYAVILSILTILLFFYWANYFRSILKEQPGLGIVRSANKIRHEFIETPNGLDFIAQIPGQITNLRVNIDGGKLVVSAGKNNLLKIKIRANLIIENYTFKNGTLIVNLRTKSNK